MKNLKTASVLAFERKLCPSDALLYSGKWKHRDDTTKWSEVPLQQKDVRGTISNRQKKDKLDPLKLDAEIQKPNLQSVDVASLPFDADTLKLEFTLKVLGNIALPSTCNNPEYQQVLFEKVDLYLNEQQCRVLSERYAENIANGRFLWRNRLGAEEVEVRVEIQNQDEGTKVLIFNSMDYSLRRFTGSADQKIDALAKVISQGLMGKKFCLLQVEAYARVGSGQEVYPSQELVQDQGNDKYKKSKVLYAVNEVAALHSQKIGNALRTIDTWHPHGDELGPIAVEPFGSVTNRGVAYRQPKEKIDFYSLLDNWILKDKEPSLDQQHYVIACLIRGGVFGDNAKD